MDTTTETKRAPAVGEPCSECGFRYFSPSGCICDTSDNDESPPAFDDDGHRVSRGTGQDGW